MLRKWPRVVVLADEIYEQVATTHLEGSAGEGSAGLSRHIFRPMRKRGGGREDAPASRGLIVAVTKFSLLTVSLLLCSYAPTHRRPDIETFRRFHPSYLLLSCSTLLCSFSTHLRYFSSALLQFLIAVLLYRSPLYSSTSLGYSSSHLLYSSTYCTFTLRTWFNLCALLISPRRRSFSMRST